MMLDWSKMEIYLKPGFTDMRRQINGLAQLVEEEMEKNPFSRALFLFCSRDCRKLKVLYWDRNGFCLWQKRLEQDRFPWPARGEVARALTYRELEMLLAGINFFQAHKTLSYSEI